MKQTITTKSFVACPSCGGLAGIDHTEIGRSYTWWCGNRSCGKQFRWLQVSSKHIEAEATGVVVTPCSVLLKLVPTLNDIHIVVDGSKHVDSDLEYYYNEYTCPTNYLKSTQEIYNGGYADEHGIFKYVADIEGTEAITLEDFRKAGVNV